MAEDDYLLDLQLANMNLGEEDESNHGQGASSSSTIPPLHPPPLPAASCQLAPSAAVTAPPPPAPPAAVPPPPTSPAAAAPSPPRRIRQGQCWVIQSQNSRPCRHQPAPQIPRQHRHGRLLLAAPHASTCFVSIPRPVLMRPYATGHPTVSRNDLYMLSCCSLLCAFSLSCRNNRLYYPIG